MGTTNDGSRNNLVGVKLSVVDYEIHMISFLHEALELPKKRLNLFYRRVAY